MEDRDSFLRSLQIAILVLQKMLESAAGICKRGRRRNVSSSKAPKASKGSMFASPLTPHPLPYHNAINKSPGAGTQRSQSSSQSQTVVLSWEFIQYRAVRSHMKFGAVYVKVLVIIHTTYHVPASLPKFLVFAMIPKGSSSLRLSLPLPLFFFLPSICSFFKFFITSVCACVLVH